MGIVTTKIWVVYCSFVNITINWQHPADGNMLSVPVSSHISHTPCSSCFPVSPCDLKVSPLLPLGGKLGQLWSPIVWHRFSSLCFSCVQNGEPLCSRSLGPKLFSPETGPGNHTCKSKTIGAQRLKWNTTGSMILQCFSPCSIGVAPSWFQYCFGLGGQVSQLANHTHRTFNSHRLAWLPYWENISAPTSTGYHWPSKGYFLEGILHFCGT